MSDERGSMIAPPPVKVVTERMPLARVLKAALSMDFAAIHDLPDEEQRRVGFMGMLIGAPVLAIGGLLALWLVRVTGLRMNKLFGLVAAFGAILFAIGSYRVSVSIFPSLRGSGRLASLARMFIVLCALVGIGLLLLVLFVLGSAEPD